MTRKDEEVLTAFPAAAIDHDNLDLYRGLLERRLLINRCSECGYWHHPPRSVCPLCWSQTVIPTEIGGRGIVYMTVRTHQARTVPELIATVELAEQVGLRISAMMIEEAHIGDSVEVDWIERQQRPYPVFRLLRGDA